MVRTSQLKVSQLLISSLNKQTTLVIVVSGLSYSVVLGRDFLQQNRAIINMGAQTVEFLGNYVLQFANEDPPTHSFSSKVF